MTQSTEPVKRDFTYWKDLALNDPEQFETRRAETISRAIARAPAESRLRLERLQWRVDRARERSATPMAATLEISRMMWDSFNSLRDSYHQAFTGQPGTQGQINKAKSASIIPFPEARKD